LGDRFDLQVKSDARGASITKEVVRRVDELFAIERENPFADL